MICLVFAGLGLLLGSLVAGAPQLAFAALGLILFFALAHIPAHVWATGAILAAVFSRLIVAGTGLPPSMNFVHFPLALAAASLAFLLGKNRTSLTRWLEAGLGAFLGLCFLSTAINGGEIARPFLTWLVFCEPFLILYAILRTVASDRSRMLLWGTFFACVLLQFPFAVVQAITQGTGDTTQGTFVGSGAGHHVAGGLALLGMIVCLAKILGSQAVREKAKWICMGGFLLPVPILSDAKQAIVAFALALFALSFGLLRRNLLRSLTLFLLLAGTVSICIYFSSQFQAYLQDYPVVLDGARGKIESFETILEHQQKTPGGVLIGLGPGNSVSRVGLMAVPSYGKEDSPVAILGLQEARTTDAIMQTWTTHPLWSRSSIWSGISSWFGLFGDLGIVGLLLYIIMFGWSIWTNAKDIRTEPRHILKATLLMCAILGGVFSWLEEPGFTLPAILLVTLALLPDQDKKLTPPPPHYGTQ